MPVIISDDILRESGLGEKDALVEIACRLFDAGKISLPLAARLAALEIDVEVFGFHFADRTAQRCQHGSAIARDNVA